MIGVPCEQGYAGGNSSGWPSMIKQRLSGKLRRGSLRYTEAVELADVLGYDLVWQKRREVR